MATVGNTSAPSTNTVYYDALLSTTLDAYVGSGTMFDNIFKDSAFLSYLRTTDAVTYQNGGERIRAPLMYGDNSTIGPHDGYDIIDTTPQDGMTTAFYEWREVAGTISISRKEERQNSGEAALIQLLQSKIMQAEMTLRESLNKQLIVGASSSSTFVPLQSASGALGLNPLGWFLRKDNTVDPILGGNVGNIDSTDNSWWRHHTAITDTGTAETGNDFALSVSTWKGLSVALKRMYNYCSRGTGGSPDLILADQETFEQYESGLDDKVRYTNTRMADQGFDSIKLRGATILWDEQVPDIEAGTAAITKGTAFFLNTKFYKLCIDSETDVITTPFVEPENQTAKTAKVLFMGNAICSNLRKLGVVYAVPRSIVS